LRSSRDAGSWVRRNLNVASVPGFFILVSLNLKKDFGLLPSVSHADKGVIRCNL